MSTTVSAPTFPQSLAALRNQHSLTQQTAAQPIGGHAVQLRRCEVGASRSAFNVIRKTATAVQVRTDTLFFGQDERDPGEDLRLQFEAISRFYEEEKRVISSMLEGMIRKRETRCWSANRGERK